MKLYIELVKNTLQANLAYRADVFISTLSSIIKLFIQVYIWVALFKGENGVTSNSGIITLKEMITYVIISTGISVFTGNSAVYRVSEKIKSGEIAMDLIKPFSFKTLLLCETVANSISNFFIKFTPILIIGILFLDFFVSPFKNIILFIIALANGMLINYMISYLFGLSAFWYLNTWQFDRLLRSSMITILSGAFLPLWFMPRIALEISNYLPFRHVFFTPITIYLGKVGLISSLGLIAQQFVWVLILVIIEKIVWKKGIRKLVVQGG